jgi:hypothetical protein
MGAGLGALAPGRSRGRAIEASYVGWSAMPPDEVVDEYWDEPRAWVFCRSRDFTAPVMARVLLPFPEREIAIRETIVINRTVVVRDQHFAVNPGIPPTLIAAEVGRPLRSYEVRPVILAGTARLPGAVELRAEEFRTAQPDRIRVTARETRNEIRPSDRSPQIQPLRRGEQGRFFDNRPRAVERFGQGQPTTGQGPGGREQQGQAPGREQQRQQGQAPGQQPQQQGRDAGRAKQQQGQQPPQPPQGTQGRGGEDQRQQGKAQDLAKEQGKAKDLGKQQGKAKELGKEQGKAKELGKEQGKGAAQQQPRQPSATEGRGTDQRRQGREQQGRELRQPQPPQQGRSEQRQPQQERGAQRPLPQGGTEGRGGGQPRGEGRAMPQQQRPSTTEGRGGGQPRVESRPMPQQQPRPSATEGRGGGQPGGGAGQRPGGAGQPKGGGSGQRPGETR